MLEIIKEAGIFVIIAQALLYFVPAETYVKYVKVLIGILLIFQFAGSFLRIMDEDIPEKILQNEMLILENTDDSYKEVTGKLPYVEIYEEISLKIEETLLKEAVEGFKPKQVKIIQKEAEFFLEITVEKQGEVMSPENLSSYYGEILGMEKEYINIIVE